MAIAEAMAGTPPAGSVTEMERLLAEHIRGFCAQCDVVIRRGYTEIIRGTPSAEMFERHRRDLLWALRSGRLYHRLTASEEFADRSVAELTEAKLGQLEEHWKYIYERPSQEEAEKLQTMIHEMFPDESGA